MNYIETLAPRGYDPYALFVYPYQEGVRNLHACYNQPTLWGRVKQAGVGILLLIPLINTVAFLILRDIFTPQIFNEAVTVLDNKGEISLEIQNFRERRNQAIQNWQISKIEYEQIAIIEAEAVKHMRLYFDSIVHNHLMMSAQHHRALINLDGQIYEASYEMANVNRLNYLSASFTQVGGVHQYDGENQLCGYYALFFMYQAVSNQCEFTNRNALHPMLVKWTEMIAKKRAQNWLYSHRDRQIPEALEVSVRGVSPNDIQFLIENDPDLVCLRKRTNCFIIEMDAFSLQDNEREQWNQQHRERIERGEIDQMVPYPADIINSIGNKTRIPEFPIFFIMKGLDAHYYFIWAEKPWVFQVVHSMGFSIHNPEFFQKGTFIDIVKIIETDFFINA